MEGNRSTSRARGTMSVRTVFRRVYSGFGDFSLRIWQNATIRGITDGLINLIPLVLISSILIAITNLPIPGMQEFFNRITGNNWTLVTNMLVFSTQHIVGLAALLSVSYTLASQSKQIQKREISAFIPMFTAFSSYVVLLVWDYVSFQAVSAGQSPGALFAFPGQSGVFFALFVAVVASKLFALFSRLGERIPWFRRRIVGSYSHLRSAMRSVGPMFFTLACFVALRLFTDWLGSLIDVQGQVGEMLVAPVAERSLFSILGTVLLMQLLWFLGAHGNITIQTFMKQAMSGTSANSTATSTATATAASASATAPAATSATASTTAEVFTNWDFYHIFVTLGGAGVTIALLLALLVFGSANRGKRIGRISIFPVAFNINETLLFGLPIVFNPFFFIPFLIAPLLVALVVYGAFSLGIVPPIVSYVEWTTPILFSGYLSTGSFLGSILQVLCVAVAFAVYAPFVRISERAVERHQCELFDQFKVEASYAANNPHLSVAGRRDEIGRMAGEFITEISESFERQRVPFFMMYQPKTDEQGKVVGAEALLRWNHPLYGFIPPNILIELADEADLTVPMSRWITTQSLEELARWRQRGHAELVLSINLNLRHILTDDSYPEFLDAELKRLNLDPALIELEITEHVAVTASKETMRMFSRLRGLGVQLSIDDMGMGYSSLNYIIDFGASVVKLDISLIDHVTTDAHQREIVHSIINLAQQIDLAVIVEGVEETEQVETLIQLGCHYFQGYYFSKPLSPQDFLDYVDEHGTTHLTREGRG